MTVLLIMAAVLLLQTPYFQKIVADKVLEELSQSIDGRITCDKVIFRPFNTIVLKGVTIHDINPASDPQDPQKEPVSKVMYADYLSARFSLEDLTSGNILDLNSITGKGIEFNLVLEDNRNKPGEYTNNLSRVFRLYEEDEVETDLSIHIGGFALENTTFRLKNYSSDKMGYNGGIDWDDLEVSDIHLRAKDLSYGSGILEGQVEELSFKEKSGYECYNLEGKAQVGSNLARIQDLYFSDPWSDLTVPEFSMKYKGADDFSDYISNVVMEGDVVNSIVSLKTIGYFAPEVSGYDLTAYIEEGGFSGTVDSLNVNKVNVSTLNGSMSGIITGQIKGIPDVSEIHIDGNISNGFTTIGSLEEFINIWTEKEIKLSGLSAKSSLRINGNVAGSLNDMAVSASIRSGKGTAECEVLIEKMVSSDKPIRIDGKLSTSNINIGRLIGNDLIGKTTMTADIDATIGQDETKAIIHSLGIDSIDIYGYNYHNIHGVGILSEEAFNGRITCDDPNLNMIVEGYIGLKPKKNETEYRFVASLGRADLNAINLDPRDRSIVNFETIVDFKTTETGDIYGNINVRNLNLENSKGRYDIGDISLSSISRDNLYKMTLRSQFADANYTGTSPVTEFFKDLENITVKRELPSLYSSPEYNWSGNKYNIDVSFKQSKKLLDFILPGAYIAEGTSADVRINAYGRLNASLSSQRLAYKNNYMKDIDLKISNGNDRLTAELVGSEFKVATLTMNDNRFRVLADNNHIGADYAYHNIGELENLGEFVAYCDIDRIDDEVSYDINILPSTIHLNSRVWQIEPSHLKVKKDGMEVSGVSARSKEQLIKLYGNTSKVKNDTLTLDLNRFDLSVLNPIIGENYGIRGAATGSVRLTTSPESMGVLADILCDSTHFAGVPIGTMNVSSIWNEEFKRFEMEASNELDGVCTMSASGRLTPRTGILEAEGTLNGANLGYLQPLMVGIFSDLDGDVYGDLWVEGPLDNLRFGSSGARVENAQALVDITNVVYFAEGRLRFDDTGLYFDDVDIRDRYTGTAKVTGSINWDNKFNNVTFDTHIAGTDMEGFDLEYNADEYFYGNIFGSGEVSFTGPLSLMTMDINAVTAKTGDFYIPISYAETSSKSNLLKFTELPKEIYVDPYDVMVAENKTDEDEYEDFIANIHIEAEPNVKAYIEIDHESGHKIYGTGSGIIDMKVSDEIFDVNGDYTINDGTYEFVAMGIMKRDFTIQSGSTVTFTGDVFESTLDIDALYKTKASLSTLIADTTSVSNRRTVECGIKITDKLFNPRLAFSINIPELDPMIESKVKSALSTEDKVQRQFLSILLSNSFIPDEQSGIVNNSSMFYSNVTEVMANQLNNILQKLNIPVDLGLNYQPNDKGNDVFDIAISTQMFNNRVSVNGSVGNKQYTSGNTQNDVVGDLDIEVKINSAGSLRLNLFSHSADSYTNYLDNTQRNGVGIAYQNEFNSLKEFITNVFTSRKKKKEKALEQLQDNVVDEERTVIIIEKDKKKNGRKKRKTVSDTVTSGGK